MADSKKLKGMMADGEKIKALRRKAGHTQKGLIKGAGIELRTYQRAEQGLAILPDILQQIAVVLGVEVNELRQKSTGTAEPANTFRLHCAAQIGANKLLTELQWGNDRINYRLDIDPGSDVAEKVAALIEKCQLLQLTPQLIEYRMNAAEHVRTIGILNDLIAEVSNLGVNLYFGTFHEYRAEKCSETQLGPEVTGSDTLVPYTIELTRRLDILLSHQTVPTLTRPLPGWLTREVAQERALKMNLEMGILPQWLAESASYSFTNDALIELYRAAFSKRFPDVTAKQKAAA